MNNCEAAGKELSIQENFPDINVPDDMIGSGTAYGSLANQGLL